MIMSKLKIRLTPIFALMVAGTAQAATLPNVNGLHDGPEFVQNTIINGRTVLVPIDCNTLSDRDDRGNIITTASRARTLAPTDQNQTFLLQFEQAFAHGGEASRARYLSARTLYNHLTIGHGVSPQSISDAVRRCNGLYFR